MSPEVPSDQSKEGFSSAKEARELITELPKWINSEPSSDQNTVPTYEFPPPTAERDPQLERELAESFRENTLVAVPRNPDKTHPAVWTDNSGWKVVGTNGGMVLVEKPDEDGATLTKSVSASELVNEQPILNPEDSLSIPSEDKNLREWTVVSQAENREVRILSKYSSNSGKSIIRQISAVEADKYKV